MKSIQKRDCFSIDDTFQCVSLDSISFLVFIHIRYMVVHIYYIYTHVYSNYCLLWILEMNWSLKI